MFNPSYDPLKLMTSGLALWADTARMMQAQYVTAVARATEAIPGELAWKTVEIPVLTLKMGLSEERLRETFQTSANNNMNAWVHTANILAAMPEWTRWPSEGPGRAFTDLFDMARAKK